MHEQYLESKILWKISLELKERTFKSVLCMLFKLYIRAYITPNQVVRKLSYDVEVV